MPVTASVSPSENPSTVDQPETPAQRATAASNALALAADQLRADAASRSRDAVLLDVLTVDVLAFADWLDRRAWLLSVDPAEATRLDDAWRRRQVDADDELLQLDPDTVHECVYRLGEPCCTECGEAPAMPELAQL